MFGLKSALQEKKNTYLSLFIINSGASPKRMIQVSAAYFPFEPF
jgi:hypothetical protein